MFHYAQQMEPNQREQLPGTVPNSAGGFSFQVDEWTRLDRLLILGTENGSYYSSARKLTRDSAASALQCITANVEPCHAFVAFTSGPMGWRPPSISWVTISPKSRLTDVCRGVQALPAGGTDCALPMVFAKANKISVDVFVLYTDSETWHGDVHPSRALREYRQAMGLPAKLVVVSMIANEFSIADPNDAGMLDVVGFDTATPALISDFAR